MKWRYILIPTALLVVALIFYFLPAIVVSSNTFYKEQSKYEKYNQSYNSTRRKLGIPLLPDNWYTEDTSIKPNGVFAHRNYLQENHWLSQVWSSNQESHHQEPFHKEKEIRRFTKEIDNEIDRFVYPANDTTQYMLELNYSYLGYGDGPWECALMTIEEGKNYNIHTSSLSIHQADSVLHKWELSRMQ